MASNVKNKHPLYTKFHPSWQMMRDAVDGEEVVKQRGLMYLPMKTGMLAITDETRRNTAYLGYQTRAEFPELVAPTITGSKGLIHNKATTYEVPPALEYILEKCTLDGQTLESFHEEITRQLLTTGRFGILPGVKKNGEFYLAGYAAEAIINWDASEGEVDYVVLDESGDKRDPVNNIWSYKEQYLELKMINGGYVATRYDGDTPMDPITSSMKNGKALDRLPFVFINSSNLNADPDDVPLYGLAKICYRIYRMDADYTQSLHMTSEPTPWVSGYDNPAKAAQEGHVPQSIGASTIWILPKGGNAGFLEFNGSGLEAQANAISSSLERAVLFGVQILSEENQSGESGKSRKLRLNTQNSLLMAINKVTAAGLEKALRNIAVWAGIDPELVKVTPPDDLMDWTMDPQELTALVNGWMSGGYSKQTLFYNIKRGGLVPNDRTFEEEEELIDSEGPALSTITGAPNDAKANPDDQGDQTGGVGATSGGS